MLSIIGNVVSWIGGRFVAWGLGSIASAFTGFIGPAITGIASFIGGILTAIGEIIAAMSKSPEGRWGLALIAIAIFGVYGRWHYIQQGRAEGVASVHPKIVEKLVRVAAKCPETPSRKR